VTRRPARADALLFDFGGMLDTDGRHWSEKLWDFYARCGLAVDKPGFEQAFVEGDRRLARGGPLHGVGMSDLPGRQLRAQSILPARACGCQTIWRRGRSWRPHPEPAPDVLVIAHLAELPGVLGA
jgi:hypothetical protein